MKYVKQFLIILVISFLGEVLHKLLPLPIPASIYGILTLLILLETGLIKVSAIRETAAFLVEIMPLMFIPPAVEIMAMWGIIKDSWIQYLLISALSTFAVIAVSGLVTQWMIRRSKKKEQS